MTTAIGWCDETWNPVVGCTKVSPGCKNCYAEKMHDRLTKMGQLKYGGPFSQVRPWPPHLDQPLSWRKPRRVFVNSMSDLFHEDVRDEYIAAVFGVMAAAHRHTFQILTKRAARMRRWVAWIAAVHGEDGSSLESDPAMGCEIEAARRVPTFPVSPSAHVWPLPNVWLGVSVEDQQRADERIPLLLETPAAVRFLSVEPMLGPVELFDVDGNISRRMTEVNPHESRFPADVIDWVICGAESGPGRRPFDPAWALDLRDQCHAAGVPFFFKQGSHRLPGEQGDAPDELWTCKEFPQPAGESVAMP